MKRQRPNLPNEDSTRTTFHYNTRSFSRKGLSTADTVDESASLRVTKRRRKKNKISDENLYLPIDLVVEILKRLPVKTLARFLCVSKLWSSIIRSRDFKESFLDESSNRPGRLFFNFRRRAPDKADFLFSSNPGADSVATYHLTQPIHEHTINSSSCVHDLICYRTASPSELVVYNSTTKRSNHLPKLEPPESPFLRHLLGYDPIEGVYKVLCMSVISQRLVFKILTLGNGNEWREIENTSHVHLPFNTQICTNGVVYYDAIVDFESEDLTGVVMSFDLRSEKFDLIKGPGTADFRLNDLLTLTRYEGKLAFISTEISADGGMEMWVLEDAVKHQWLKKIFVLPDSWTSLAQDTRILSPPHELHYFRNITVAGEFILAPLSICVPPFYVLYYDPKRHSMRKVSIEGIMEHELLLWNGEELWFLYSIFSSQVESLTFW